MIVSVNGKSVGGMTEAEFQIELDLCGAEVLLVVSKLDLDKESFGLCGKPEKSLGDIAMDWNDIGAITPSEKKVSFNNDNIPKNSFVQDGDGETEFGCKQKIADNQLDMLIQKCPAVRTPVPMKTSLVSSTGQTKKASSGSSSTIKPWSMHETNGGINSFSKSHSASSTVSSIVKKSGATGVKESRKQIEEQSDMSEDEFTLSLGNRKKLAKSKDEHMHTQMESQDDSMEDEEEFDSEDDDDENPWLGW
jgi:hypothetical protein